jgi:hypothetical protein
VSDSSATAPLRRHKDTRRVSDNIKHINFWSALMALIYGTETYTKIFLAAIKRGGFLE